MNYEERIVFIATPSIRLLRRQFDSCAGRKTGIVVGHRGYKSSMTPATEQCKQEIFKATVLAPRDAKANSAAPENQDLFDGLDALDPPHDPAALCHTFEHSNSLRQTVDAYATNIDGFGHRLECTINFDAENADAEVAKSLRLEAMAKGESCPKLSRREVARRRRELKDLAEAERARLDDILTPSPLPPIHRALARVNKLPIARLSIDNSGIGMNLARELPQVVPETFTNARKEQSAVHFNILLQRREVALPKDRKLVSQIHSIKRTVLPAGKVSFDSGRPAKNGHADKFWAVALACQQEGPRTVVDVTAWGVGTAMRSKTLDAC